MLAATNTWSPTLMLADIRADPNVDTVVPIPTEPDTDNIPSRTSLPRTDIGPLIAAPDCTDKLDPNLVCRATETELPASSLPLANMDPHTRAAWATEMELPMREAPRTERPLPSSGDSNMDAREPRLTSPVTETEFPRTALSVNETAHNTTVGPTTVFWLPPRVVDPCTDSLDASRTSPLTEQADPESNRPVAETADPPTTDPWTDMVDPSCVNELTETPLPAVSASVNEARFSLVAPFRERAPPT